MAIRLAIIYEVMTFRNDDDDSSNEQLALLSFEWLRWWRERNK